MRTTTGARLVAATATTVLLVSGCSGADSGPERSALPTSSASSPTSLPAEPNAPEPTSAQPTPSQSAASSQDPGSTAAPGDSATDPTSAQPPTSAPSRGPSSFTPGDVRRTAAPAPAERTSTGSLEQQADLGGQVGVQITQRRALKLTARVPGETSGAGVALTVRVINGGPQPLDLGGVLVDVRGSDGQPAAPLSSAPAAAMSGTLRPGGSATGTYVFVIPEDHRQNASVLIRVAADSVVQLKGNL